MILELKKKKWIKKLVSMPETGMGYQIVDITLKDGRVISRVTVSNATLVGLPANESISENNIAKIKLSI